MKKCFGFMKKKNSVTPYTSYDPPPPPQPVVDDDLLLLSPPRFTYGDLKMFTDDFSDANFIGRTQFCNLYRGIIPHNGNEKQVVTVKIWVELLYHRHPNKKYLRQGFPKNFQRFKNEVMFLSTEAPTIHPNLVKLMGWCCEIDNETMGVVFDLNPYDTLRNLIPRDMLKWEDRIKIVAALASFLEALHNHQPQYLVLNISAAHIIIDQDWNPVLLDFGMLNTKIDLRAKIRFPYGAYGYQDPSFSTIGYSYSTDVFCFGVILMELLRKCNGDGGKDFKVERPIFLHLSVCELFYSLEKAKWVVPSGTMVEKSLMEDVGFHRHDEIMLTMLAVECIYQPEPFPRPSKRRPRMKKVVSRLKYLYVLKSNKCES